MSHETSVLTEARLDPSFNELNFLEPRDLMIALYDQMNRLVNSGKDINQIPKDKEGELKRQRDLFINLVLGTCADENDFKQFFGNDNQLKQAYEAINSWLSPKGSLETFAPQWGTHAATLRQLLSSTSQFPEEFLYGKLPAQFARLAAELLWEKYLVSEQMLPFLPFEAVGRFISLSKAPFLYSFVKLYGFSTFTEVINLLPKDLQIFPNRPSSGGRSKKIILPEAVAYLMQAGLIPVTIIPQQKPDDALSLIDSFYYLRGIIGRRKISIADIRRYLARAEQQSSEGDLWGFCPDNGLWMREELIEALSLEIKSRNTKTKRPSEEYCGLLSQALNYCLFIEPKWLDRINRSQYDLETKQELVLLIYALTHYPTDPNQSNGRGIEIKVDDGDDIGAYITSIRGIRILSNDEERILGFLGQRFEILRPLLLNL